MNKDVGKWWGLYIVAFLVTSCATTLKETQSIPHPRTGEPFSIEENDPDASSPAAIWASRFGDDTLNGLIEEALESNIGLDAAKASAKAAEAAARISGSLKSPNLTLGLNSAKQESRFSFLNFQKIDTDTHSLSFGSQWEVDLWGRLRASYAAGLAELDAAEADVEALKLSISGQVARAWFNLLESQSQYELAIDSAQSLEDKVKSLDRRYDRGLVTSLDLRLTRAQAASSKAVAQQRKTQLGNAKRALETLLGRYPSGKQSSEYLLPDMSESIPEGLSSDLVSRRPDLYAAERRLAASLSRQEAANRNWLPNLSLTGSAGTTSSELSDLLDSDFSVWTIAGNVGSTLFAAGRKKAERDQAEAIAEGQFADFRLVAQTAFQEVENALFSEENLAQLSKETAIAAEESRKAEELAWEQYQRGLIDITALLDAQRRADESASQLVNVKNQRLQNRINLHLALGGDFE